MFIQPDWFEVTQLGVGTNRYSYSFNDPVNLNDPNGNCVWDVCALESIALGGLLVGAGVIITNGPDVDLGDLGLNGQRPLGLGERFINAVGVLSRNLSNTNLNTEEGGKGHSGGPTLEEDDWAEKAGIPGTKAHGDGDVKNGKFGQREKPGGRAQAEEDFERVTGGISEETRDGKRRGQSANGDVLIIGESGRGANPSKEKIPTIWVNGNKLRYPEMEEEKSDELDE